MVDKRKLRAEATAVLRSIVSDWRDCDRLWRKATNGTNLERSPLPLQIPADDVLEEMTPEEILELSQDIAGMVREYLGILETLGRRLQTA